MANTDHLKQLRAGKWNEWRAANPALAPDLIDAELAGADLRGLDFSKAHLRGADLSGARLDGADLSRAILEGAAFGARHLLESLADAGYIPTRLVAVGGGTKGPLWPQIVSDATGIAQEMPAETVGASYGDAWFAGVASGLVDPDTDWSRIVARVTPNAANREAYDRVYGVFRELYPATADTAHALAAQARDNETDRS